MPYLLLISLILSAFFQGTLYAPKHHDPLTPHNALAILKAMPGVKVKLTGPENAKHTIIHLADVHFVPFDQFTADLKDQGATDTEIAEAYQDHLHEVEKCQVQQVAILRALIRHHGLRSVLVEGITRQNAPFVDIRIMLAREIEQKLLAINKRKAETKPGSELHSKIVALLSEHRQTMLAIGAAGRLVVTGELPAIYPLDDAKALEDAYPLMEGKFRIDPKANAIRERAMIANAMKPGPVSVIILGRGHRLEGNEAKIIRVNRGNHNE